MLHLPSIQEAEASAFDRVIGSRTPVVFRGFTSDWPLVRAAKASIEDLCGYLLKFDNRALVEAFIADPEIRGRFYYDNAMRGFNFQRTRLPLQQVLAIMRDHAAEAAKVGIYMGSTPAAHVLPGFERENPLPGLDGKVTEPRMWLGNETNVAAHFDESNNLACVAAGRRRFVLFPPEQIANLYVGPIDMTVAGPPTSMVDLTNPDVGSFPKIADALAAATSATLEPGDAIYIPALWWHHVEALDPVNLLVNYWWQDGPPDAGTPFALIAHGLLTISHLPREQRQAWRIFLDHYVFRLEGDPVSHIPVHARGVLGDSSPVIRQRIKSFIMRVIAGG